MYIHTYIYTYVYTYIHTYIHTYIRIFLHATITRCKDNSLPYHKFSKNIVLVSLLCKVTEPQALLRPLFALPQLLVSGLVRPLFAESGLVRPLFYLPQLLCPTKWYCYCDCRGGRHASPRISYVKPSADCLVAPQVLVRLLL